MNIKAVSRNTANMSIIHVSVCKSCSFYLNASTGQYRTCIHKDDRIGGESVTLIFSFNYVEIK